MFGWAEQWDVCVETKKFRIIEWTSQFQDGSYEVKYELQSKDGQKTWRSLGTSATLSEARMALILLTPNNCCWLG
jgi:hypothetical protein